MTSLKQQIAHAIDYYELSGDDVLWVGSDDGEYAITWEQFTELMNDYPSNMPVAENLVIVGLDWWLESKNQSHEWILHRQPVKKPDARPFSFIQGRQRNSGIRFLCDDDQMN